NSGEVVGQRADQQAVLVDRYVDDLEPVVAGRGDRVQVPGVLDRDPVPGAARDREQQAEPVDGAVGDEYVLRAAGDSADPGDVVRECGAKRGESGRCGARRRTAGCNGTTSVTKVPAPVRPSIQPSACSWSYAACVTDRDTESSRARSRVDGNR